MPVLHRLVYKSSNIEHYKPPNTTTLQEEEREMKYRLYYQRVLKDRLTALRKVGMPSWNTSETIFLNDAACEIYSTARVTTPYTYFLMLEILQ